MEPASVDLLSGALQQALADFGLRGASDPARIRGVLTDVLGARAQGLANGITAVVAACAIGIPDHIRSNPTRSDAELADLVAEAGIEGSDAAIAVAIWRRALAPFMQATLNAPDVVLPTLLPSASATPLTPLSATVLPESAIEAVDIGAPPRRGPRRRGAVVALIVAAALATTGIAWAAVRSDDTETVTSGTTSTTTATTSSQTTTTTKRRIPTPNPDPLTTSTTQPEPATTATTKPKSATTATTKPPTATTKPKPPTVTTKPTPPPPSTTNGVPRLVATDIYVSIKSCWVNGAWTSHYLGMTQNLPSGWDWVTYPTTGKPTSYGQLTYGNGDYYYQPDSRYGGRYNDAFYYAYRNSSGTWSNWAITHIAIDTTNNGC